MLIAAMIFASLAALLHVYFFVLESITWTTPRTRAVFGTTAEEAETTKLMALNQGFYNLFLAIVTGVGVLSICLNHKGIGSALIFAGAGSMVGAALVLAISAPDKLRGAFVQGTMPLIGVALLAAGLTLG